MYTDLLRRALFAERRQHLASKIARYEQRLTRAEIEQHQIERFNQTWAYCLAEVPFYRSWRAEYGLPERIRRPADLAAFPPLEKRDLIGRSDEIFQHGAITLAYTTGGSTGQPTRYPRSIAEQPASYANNYLGRSWWGIQPFDPQVLIWGHSHLFGSGLRGRLAQARRRAADRLVNITRVNGYDLSEPSLRSHYTTLRRRNPALLVGYTSAIFKLARYIERNRLDLGGPRRLRAVIVTAESVSDADIMVIERVFKAPAVVEYGAAETGVLAMSRHTTRHLQIIWDSFICLVANDGALHVTTLDQRLFPLINYAIGDTVEAGDIEDGNALWLRSVLGRQQDIVRIATLDRGILDLSAILPVHILKSYPGIIGVQFRQDRPDALRIYLEADHELDVAHVTAFFLGELRKDHPDLDPVAITLEQSAEQARTRAGKHALFVS